MDLCNKILTISVGSHRHKLSDQSVISTVCIANASQIPHMVCKDSKSYCANLEADPSQ